MMNFASKSYDELIPSLHFFYFYEKMKVCGANRKRLHVQQWYGRKNGIESGLSLIRESNTEIQFIFKISTINNSKFAKKIIIPSPIS